MKHKIIQRHLGTWVIEFISNGRVISSYNIDGDFCIWWYRWCTNPSSRSNKKIIEYLLANDICSINKQYEAYKSSELNSKDWVNDYRATYIQLKLTPSAMLELI